MTDTTWAYWQAMIAGQTPPKIDGPQTGYWRLPVKGKTVAGASMLIDWSPVAIWIDPKDGLVGTQGRDEKDARNLTQDQCIEMWPWISDKPIPFDVYNLVFTGGEWPDADKLKKLPPVTNTHAFEAGPRHGGSHCEVCGYAKNNPIHAQAADTIYAAEVPEPPKKPEEPKHEAILRQITEYEAELDAYIKKIGRKIEAEEQNAEITRLRGVIAGLRIIATREQKAEAAPLYKVYKEAHDKWNPPIKLGEKAEAKGAALQNPWETLKAANAKRAAEETARREAEAAEQAERYADRATTAAVLGEELPEPPPNPDPVVPNTPPPATRLAVGGGGRAKPTRKVNVVTIVDQAKVYAYFADQDAVKTVLQQLAQTKVNAGVTDIPGITIEEEIRT